MELFEAIRRDHRRDGLSIRALSDRHGVHRRTVRQALGDAVPPVRKSPVRAAPKLDPAKAMIDAMLMVDLTAALLEFEAVASALEAAESGRDN